jgi:hypothetical protein
MSFYIKSPYKPAPKLMVQGTPEYLFGSLNSDVAPTQGAVLYDSGNGTTSTYVIKIYSGNIPIPDSLFTVVGSVNAAGAYNVTNAPILTVSAPASPDEGVYTITVAGTGTSAVAQDSGLYFIAVPEIGDFVTTFPVSSGPACSPVAGPNSLGKSLSATFTIPANTAANPNTLAAVTVLLQGSNVDRDDQYNTVATIATAVAAGTTTDWQSGQGDPTAPSNVLSAGNVTLLNFRFYRFQISTGATGTGTVIAKLMQ